MFPSGSLNEYGVFSFELKDSSRIFLLVMRSAELSISEVSFNSALPCSPVFKILKIT